MDPQTLFDLFYSEKVQDAYFEQKKKDLENSAAIEQNVNKSKGFFKKNKIVL